MVLKPPTHRAINPNLRNPHNLPTPFAGEGAFVMALEKQIWIEMGQEKGAEGGQAGGLA